MSSAKCMQCGLVNWADVKVCKRCQSPIGVSNAYASVPDNVINFTPVSQTFDDMSGPSFSSYVSYDQSNTGMELASRGARLAAAIIDGLCVLPVFFIIFTMAFAGAQMGEEAAAGMGGGMLLLLILYIAAFAIIQLYLLCSHGQTIGKKALKIRIVKVDTGQNGGFVTNVLLRGIVPNLIGGIPLVGPVFTLVDYLFIFKDDKRCIHDLIAGSTVIKC
jgi:uncharacterized RDD family membrane protein YckC